MGLSSLVDLRTILVFSVVCLLCKFGIEKLLKCRQYPPGPWGFPVFGYLPFIRSAAHIHFRQLAHKYGGIFSMTMGNQFIVVLSDYKIIREAFRREDFTYRPDNQFSSILGGYGIVNSEGRLWKNQRKFLHDRLRRFGMTYSGKSKDQMEARIMTEVEAFLRTLVKEKGAPTDLNPSLCTSISNVICSLLMSVRFQQSDAKFSKFMDLIAEGFRLFGSLSYANFFPIMRYFPNAKSIVKKIDENRSEMAEFFQETVDSHRNSFDSGHMRDLVDNYLLEIEDAKSGGYERDLFEGKEHDRQIQQIMGDLFSAGMETIKTTILWCIVYMIHHPEVAVKIQKELDSVVGRSRLPQLEDRPNLPFTEATILEVLRISSIVPLGTTHATSRETELCGFKIPANAHVIPLIHAVHMDPNLWDGPEQFKPQRFLSPEGKVCKPEFFLPFGVGRRMCLGDVLARMELFEFFASLMHTFNVKTPEGRPPPSLKATTGVTLTPEDFQVCLTLRPLVDSQHDFLNAANQLRTAGSH
ncbi:cytochrome P450 [Nesidiocoris tenuis]|nr:cytochrome P450 [Nesidiocoris tenuis]